jgi:hypothetical protein
MDPEHWFNRNMETLCFGPKQPKQIVSKQTKTNRNNPKLFEKIPKYALYHTVSVALLFRYRTETTETTETNVLFRIVLKLVLVPVLVVLNRN